MTSGIPLGNMLVALVGVMLILGGNAQWKRTRADGLMLAVLGCVLMVVAAVDAAMATRWGG